MTINVTLLYFVLLIPLSGFIAWLGDRIGHKTGKRRHSLFGLRPRHTAMVFAIGSGMCISFVSFALVWLLSATFRMILSDGARLYQNNRDLKHENISLRSGNLGLKRDEDRFRQAAAQALTEKTTAEKQASEAGSKAQEAVAAEAHAQNDLHSAQANLNAAQSNLAASKDALQQTKSSLTHTQSQLAEKAHDLAQAQSKVDQAQLHVSQAQFQARRSDTAAQKANAAADTAQRRVVEIEQTASDTIAEQKHVLDQQKSSLADMQGQISDVTGQLETKKQALVQANTQLVNVQSQFDATQKLLVTLETKAEALREHQITYQVGEEVDRIEIKSGYQVWRLDAIVDAFLTEAAHRAEARGARKEKGAYRAIMILPQIVAPPTDDSNSADPPTKPAIFKEDDAIRAASATIRSANTDFVVIAYATTNAVVGEPVPVTLRLFKNPIVIPADTQIGDAHIDGNGTPKEIADALYSFLRRDVRTKLLTAGVIPAVSPGGDDLSAESVVTLSSDDWLHIMDNIRLAGSRARVVVTAKKDVRAGDLPPDLNFDVKGVPSAAFRTNGPY